MIKDVGEIKKLLEQREKATLSKYATLETKGRLFPIEPCVLRTEFLRDRDRIIHCKSFRRLKYKTQVFFAPSGDHYRTRLTHTLEVNQIARTISRCLFLNEDLTEAIALGHDLGHTPFGHIGEQELSKLVPSGFCHNEQSLRVVDKLEKSGAGLNLSFEVRDGIKNHRKEDIRHTLEACVVSMSDRIAYINHDIDDAIRAGVISSEMLPQKITDVLGKTHGDRINTLICDVVKQSYDEPFIKMSEEIENSFNALREFMFSSVYMDKYTRREESKARHIISSLYAYYLKNIDDLPKEFKQNIDSDGKEIAVADYIACMTDRYSVNEYKRLFVPEGV